jgi:hypothetical protein
MDMDARLQLFDLKTKYSFQTTPTVDQYNMPLYNIQTQPGSQSIASYPVYQGFLGPAYINGVQVGFHTQQTQFFNLFPNIVQNLPSAVLGDGTAGPYTIQIPILGNITALPQNPPLQGILRGHVDISGVISVGNTTVLDPPVITSAQIAAQANNPINFISTMPTTSVYPAFYITASGANNANVVVSDSGQFLQSNQNYGLLMQPGNAPSGNLPLGDGINALAYSTSLNTVNYLTGQAIVHFPVPIPVGNAINVQCYLFQTGLPRAILFYNNVLTLRTPPDRQYLVELDAYLTPAAFLSTSSAVPFAYMSEYIARGAARKILSDVGDIEQFQFYEPLFREQELLVWKRSQRQWTATRTETIYHQGMGQNAGPFTNVGGATF